jgi:hypothetical protein
MCIFELGDGILRVGAIEPLGDDPPRIYRISHWFGRFINPASRLPPVVLTSEPVDEEAEPSEPTFDLGSPK